MTSDQDKSLLSKKEIITKCMYQVDHSSRLGKEFIQTIHHRTPQHTPCEVIGLPINYILLSVAASRLQFLRSILLCTDRPASKFPCARLGKVSETNPLSREENSLFIARCVAADLPTSTATTTTTSMIKTTALHVHHAFQYISFTPTYYHDYDVKPPNMTFYGGRGHMTTNFPSSL